MKKRLLITILLIASLTACEPQQQATTNNSSNVPDTLNVVATTGQLADAVSNIAGDAVNLTGLLGPGVDPHLYVPTEGNVATFSEADVIFYNGLHLEAQMTRVMEQMAKQGVTVVSVGDALPEEQLLSWDDSAPHDPHIWNDPLLWKQVVEIIRDTMVEADSDNATVYQTNAETYLNQIQETHEYLLEQATLIPEEKRIMITAHDAFGYFARTYDFEVHGLQGVSTESEASTADVQNLASFIVERQVPALFVETSVSSRNIEAVQAAVEAQGFNVRIGGTLFSDALDSEGQPAATYLGMLRHNIDTLVAALGASPEAMK